MARVFEPAFKERRGGEGSNGVARLYVDLPGTGRSAAVAPTSDAVLDAVVATIDGLVGTGPFSVAGWSYGGYLALGLLRRLPQRVASALLVSTGTKIRPEDRDLSGTLASAEEPGWLGPVPRHLHDHVRQAVGRQTRPVAARVAELVARNAPTDGTFLDRLRAEGFRLADEDVPNTSDRPIVMLAGRRDRVAGFRSLVRALAGFPHADLLLSATAGHYLPLEEPDLLAAGVDRLVA